MNHTVTPKIMIVEDSRLMREALKTLLVSEGFDVVTSTDVQSAVTMVEDETPQLVLLDLGLPGPAGITFLEWLKANHATRQIPVLVLTSSMAKEDLLASKKQGAAEYLLKQTVDYKRLLSTISAVMQGTYSH
jgi:DNA-binding response OmpR family regulator